MESARSDLDFLARSRNRWAILDALASESLDRAALSTRSDGASRVTLSRVLVDLESRGWTETDGDRIRATALGVSVASTFGEFRDVVASVVRLRDVEPWLPAGFDVDLRALADARITTPSASDPAATLHRSVERIRSADRLRLLTASTAHESMQALRDRVVDADLDLEIVATSAVIESIVADPTMRSGFLELIEADVPVYRTDRRPPSIVAILDESVDLALADDVGLTRAIVESDHPDVVAWARSIYEAHRGDAEPVTAAELDR